MSHSVPDKQTFCGQWKTYEAKRGEGGGSVNRSVRRPSRHCGRGQARHWRGGGRPGQGTGTDDIPQNVLALARTKVSQCPQHVGPSSWDFKKADKNPKRDHMILLCEFHTIQLSTPPRCLISNQWFFFIDPATNRGLSNKKQIWSKTQEDCYVAWRWSSTQQVRSNLQSVSS